VSDNAINHFVDEVHRIINRFRHEYNINYAELIGALTLVIHDMTTENESNAED
jgi:hypothetical protein